MDKRLSLSEAAARICDGMTVAAGGNLLQRGPFALVRELARQGRRDLEIVKTAGSYDVDLLAAAGAVRAASCGYVGFENEFGMAPSYRRTVEAGRVEAREHACYTVIQGLRAAAYGLPFMPAAGFDGSDLPAIRDFRRVVDPYTGASVLTVPPLKPDVAIIHVPVADAAGNGRVYGSQFEDALMAQAATTVLLTAERIVATEELAAQPELTLIPGFLVSGVVLAPGGAWPGGCHPLYEYDADAVLAYLRLDDAISLCRYLDETAARDRGERAAW